MNRSLFAAAAIVLGSFLVTSTGCGGLEGTCKKIQELEDKEKKDDKDAKKKSDDDKKKEVDDCVKKGEEEKKKDPKKFDCATGCIDKASTMKEAGDCMSKCEGEKK